MRTHTIDMPFKPHVHFRRGDWRFWHLMKMVLETCDGAIAEPNTKRRIFDAGEAQRYYDEIKQRADELGNPDFQPYILLFLNNETTPKMVEEAAKLPFVIGWKGYPYDLKSGKGLTTGAEGGVHDWKAPLLLDCLRAMAACGQILQTHPEVPDANVDDMEREPAFRPIIFDLLEIDGLRFTIEHITTALMAHLLHELPEDRVGGGVTPQVALNTSFDDWDRRNRCKPPTKTLEDRAVIMNYILAGSPRIWSADDHAPHDKFVNPEAHGVTNANVTIQVWTEIFDNTGKLHLHSAFHSDYANNFYGRPRTGRKLTLVEDPWMVPEVIEFEGGHRVEPLWGGKSLRWRIAH